MILEVALLVAFFGVGLALQRYGDVPRLRAGAWTAYFWTVTPVLVFASFTTVDPDAELGLALAAAVISTWLVAAIGYGYATLVSAHRQERGALALGAGFPNTGFVGYPLAQLAFGDSGLVLMVVYDRLSWLVPATAVSTTIARWHGKRDAAARRSDRLRIVLANPPLLAMLAAVALRAGGVDAADAIEPLADAAAEVVGPAGFFLLGLALPLEPVAHEAAELRRAAGALAIRFGVAPLVLFLIGLALGAEIPGVFYLAAALPCAFHLLVLASVFELRPQLMRLLVVGSTVPAVAAVVAIAAIVR